MKTSKTRVSAPATSAAAEPGRIPFNRPFIVGKELFYIAQAVMNGNLSGDGEFTRRSCEWMEENFSAKRVILTHSCTAALEISALLCDVGMNDEVIMPSYTFVSTANAFALRGAKIHFVDIREDNLNIDESLIEEAITERTKAIVPVHYAGVAAEMDTINAIAARHALLVVEDAAHGVDATYKQRYLGTVGHLGTYSFHETKNLISGQGGALLVNEERFVERAEIIRDKGTDRSKFLRGTVDKYSWVDFGSSYRASELVAAFLYAQLEETSQITAKRRTIFEYYANAFAELEERRLLRLPKCAPECRHNAHMFYIILPTASQRDDLLAYLRSQSIGAVFHYVPLHNSPKGLEMSASPGTPLPVTEDISARVVRLPCYFGLERADQDRVIDAVTTFVTG